MIIGVSTPGVVPALVQADWKRVMRVTLGQPMQAVKVRVYADGLGSGAGHVPMRAVIYRASDNALMAESDELTIPDSSDPVWHEFGFVDTPGGVALADEAYDIGVHAAGPADSARLFEHAGGGATGRFAADTYADGAADPFGSATPESDRLSAFVEGFAPSPMPPVADIQLARLAWPTSQYELGATRGSMTEGRRRVEVGWHGTFVDANRGAYALVQEGSDLEELVGERVRLSVGNGPALRSVVVYVLRSAETDEELTLSRRAFAGLSRLSQTSVHATLQIVVGNV